MGGRKGWEAKISLYHRSEHLLLLSFLSLRPPEVVDPQIISRAKEN